MNRFSVSGLCPWGAWRTGSVYNGYSMKYSLLIFVGLLYCGLNTASAQVCLRKGDCKGIYVDRNVTRTEILSQFGQPGNIRAHEDEAAGGYMEIYEYERLKIAVVDGVLYDFSFSRDDLQVTVYEKYSLNVGDQYRAFLDAIPASDIMCRTYDGEVQLFFKIEGTDVLYDSSLVVAFDKMGKVVRIRWYAPV